MDSDIDSDDSMQPILTVRLGQGSRLPPIQVHVEVDSHSIPMEVDTGATVLIMVETTYHKLWPRRSLNTTNIRLQTYSKEPIPVLGTTEVLVCYEGQTAQLPLVVVKGDGLTLLGRDWLSKVKLYWSKIHCMNCWESMMGCFRTALGPSRTTKQKLRSTLTPHPDSAKHGPYPTLCGRKWKMS